MPQIINTNIASLNAQRNLNASQSAQATALERLSSGLRINSAKDDAAGLAIATRFEAQTRGLAVAIRNANDGISLAQTAEGALGSITDALQRVRELALQSANGTYSDEQRRAVNEEAQQLIAEIQRTGEQTNFNGKNLLDGTFATSFQIGANVGETIAVEIEQATADSLGTSSLGGISAVGTDVGLSNGDLIINGVAVGVSSAQDDTASTDNAAASAIAKAAAINSFSDQTGVTAIVNENVAAGSQMDVSTAASGTITLNDVSITISGSTDAVTTRSSVVAAINANTEQTGIVAVDTGTEKNGVQLIAEDGRNIELSFGTGVTAANTGLAAAGTYEGGYTLITSGNITEIEVSGGDGTGNGDIANAGLSVGTYTSGVASLTSTAQAQTEAVDSFDIPAGALLGSASNTNTTPLVAENMTIIVGDDVQTAAVDSAEDLAALLASNANISSASATNTVVITSTEWDQSSISEFEIAGESIDVSSYATFADAAAVVVTNAGSNPYSASYDEDSGKLRITMTNGANFLLNQTADEDTGDAGQIAFSIAYTDSNGDAQSENFVSTTDASTNEVTIVGNVTDVVVSDPSITDVVLTTDGATDGTGWLGDDDTSGGGDGLYTVAVTQNDLVLADGDLVVNGVSITASQKEDDTASYGGASTSDRAASGIAIAAAINKATDTTGVTALVNATELVGGDQDSVGVGTSAAGDYTAGDTGTLYINGVTVGTLTLQDDGTGALDYEATRLLTIDAINEVSGQTGVVASDNGVSITLSAADGRNLSVAIDNDAANNSAINGSFGAAIGLSSTIDGVGEADITAGVKTVDQTYETMYSTVTLESAGQIALAGSTNGADGVTDSGFTVGAFGGATSGQFLADLDISTEEGANEALTAIDNALNTLSNSRATLGALQNRFESTVANLAVTRENLTAASSRITDADFAVETAALSKAQVLQQAGISILSQANALPQQVLQLLQ